MKEMDITDVLKKAEELRALFILGQRVIPFLEEIFMFVNEIKPLLDEINMSIEENLKKMPNASKQLTKVSEATETATTEIMDIVDGLSYKVDIISSNIKKIGSAPTKVANHFKILELIYKAIQDDVDVNDVLPEISNTIEELKGDKNSVMPDKNSQDVLEHTEGILQSIKDDSMSIMISLQVQDITSQQIASVNHLLETIQNKLEKILKKFQSSDINQLVTKAPNIKEKTNVAKMHRNIAFDPDAIDSITSKETRQNDVDDLIKMHLNENIDDVANDEINEVLNEKDNTKKDDDIPEDISEKVLNIPEDIEQFSQDDIDAIFGK